MTTVSSIASGRCQQPQPSALERMALTLLRALERDIESRVHQRVATRASRHAAEQRHATGRAEAAAGAHTGILPR